MKRGTRVKDQWGREGEVMGSLKRLGQVKVLEQWYVLFDGDTGWTLKYRNLLTEIKEPIVGREILVKK